MSDKYKFLTESIGGCNQDEGLYRDSGYLCCRKCKELVRNCSGGIDFSTWDGFGKLWDWVAQQDWWEDFKKGKDHAIFWSPELFTEAVYDHLQGAPLLVSDVLQVQVVRVSDLRLPERVEDTIGDHYGARNDSYFRYYPHPSWAYIKPEVKKLVNEALVKAGVVFPAVTYREPGHEDGYYLFYILLRFDW